LIGAVNDERLAFLNGLKTWPVFGAGWGRRVAEVRAAALHMADAAAKTADAPPQSAPVTRAKGQGNGQVPVSAGAQKATAGAIIAAGAAAAQQAHHAGGRPVIVAAIVIITIMIALGGWFAWRWRQRRRQPARID
jgi:lysozyme family protein